MKIGYARVSTQEQNLTAQLEALKAAGCEKLYREKISTRATERPELVRMLDAIRQGDTLIVTKLDRLARSTRELLEIMDRIAEAGAAFLSLAEPWADTTNHAGKLIMTVFAGIAEFERERIKERCTEGRAVALHNGVRFGRPRALSAEQWAVAITMRKQGKSYGEIAQVFRVSSMTIARMFKKDPQGNGATVLVRVAYKGQDDAKDKAISEAALPGICVESGYSLKRRVREFCFRFESQGIAILAVGRLKAAGAQIV